MKKRLTGWLLLVGVLAAVGAARGFSQMDRHYIFFPDSVLRADPGAAGLAVEDITFTADDGVTLNGWLIPGHPGQPLVLFAHGNAGNIADRIDNLAQLHQLGVWVFVFDYRGYGRSAGEPSEQGTYDDIRGALTWLQGRGWTPPQMIYFGRSMGAAVALQLALEQPPAGLVLESPFTSVAAMGWHHQPLLYGLAGWWGLKARYDNLGKIDRLRCPLLLFHGARDDIVPPAMGQQLFDRAPEPKRFHLIPGAGHNDTYVLGGEDYWRQWRTFVGEVRRP